MELGLDKQYITFENLKRIVYQVPKIPREAVIEFTNVCNLSCPMCPRQIFNRPMTHMAIDDYKEIIDRLEGVREISLIGYGEPLLHPNFKEAIQYAKNAGHKVSLVSNGYPLLDETKFLDLLRSGVDAVRFSIDSITDSEKGHLVNKDVIGAIERFRSERDRILYTHRPGITNDPPRMKIIINPVVSAWNYDQIIPLIEWAQKNQFDRVDLAKWNEICGMKSELVIDKEIELYKLIKENGYLIPVTSLYDRYMGLRRIGFRFMTKCPMSYDAVYITQESLLTELGGISPCGCSFPNTTYGNILKEDLRDIWTNRKFKIFRKNQDRMCKKCTLYKLN